MFLLTLGTIITTLIWSVQLVAPMKQSAITIFINLAMMGAWITLCTVFVHKHRCPNRKYYFYKKITKICQKETNLHRPMLEKK